MLDKYSVLKRAQYGRQLREGFYFLKSSGWNFCNQATVASFSSVAIPLRLPRSLKKAVEKQSEEDGTSINQFVAMAVAEKLSALQVAEFFANRKARADFKAFDKT